MNIYTYYYYYGMDPCMPSKLALTEGNGCVRLASPGSTPVCPGLPPHVRLALTSYQGPTLVRPDGCPACGTGHLGLARGA